jgi:hypothetical protein
MVETLPVATTVDLSQLVNLSEVISAGQIPPGNYVSATVTIDYANAVISVQDANGNSMPVKPVDSKGNAITTLAETITLDKSHPLVVGPGIVGLLALDFNLAASNTVSGNTVIVSPTLTASLVPTDTRPIHVRGGLASTDAAAGDFVLDVQPLHDSSPTMGQVTVDVTATTTYIINGHAYVGAAGLTALAGLATGQMVAAFGTLVKTQSASSSGSSMSGTASAITGTITATSVVAGTSLSNARLDEVSGTVVARSAADGTITVHAATWCKPGGHDFNFLARDVTVKLGTGTVVLTHVTGGALDIGAISVGQHVDVFGQASVSNTTMSSTNASGGSMSPMPAWQSEELTLDATAGEVQLDDTPLWGVITATGTDSVTMTLKSLDGFPAQHFDFAGTGSTTATDASASAYVVSTKGLSLTGLAAGQPVRFVGLVAPFGQANPPTVPDFTAQTLVNYADVTQALLLSWESGSTTAIAPSSTSLQVSVAGVGFWHFVQDGPLQTDLGTLTTPLTVVPSTTAGNLGYSIGTWGQFKTSNFDTFADFETALAADLNGTTPVQGLMATGSYDSATATFTATHIVVVLGSAAGS